MVSAVTFSLQPITDEKILLSLSNNDLKLTDSLILTLRQTLFFTTYAPSVLEFFQQQRHLLFSGIWLFCVRTRQAGYPASSAF
jgi:hypothetical protein